MKELVLVKGFYLMFDMTIVYFVYIANRTKNAPSDISSMISVGYFAF